MRRLNSPRETRRALEIGCGPGRLMLPLSAHFAEIHGVDVADKMIELAKRNLAGVPHAHARATSGSDLAPFADQSFDFVYSYAVFQHIPSREVVMQYLREAVRVLKTDGILTFQVNGGVTQDGPAGTWAGVSLPAETLVALARESGCQVLALDRVGSRYMWSTWRKRCTSSRQPRMRPSITAVQSLDGNARVAAGRGRWLSATVANLSPDCDVTELTAYASGERASVCVISPARDDGLCDLKIALPPLSGPAKIALELRWCGEPLCKVAGIDVLPPKETPVVVSVTDGVNYLSGRHITSRFANVLIDQVATPESLSARVDGRRAVCGKPSCIDPLSGLYELNVFLPGITGVGGHRLELFEGSHALRPERITLGLLEADEVFRGAPAGERTLDIGRNDICAVAGEFIIADSSRLPFRDGQFAGIAHRSGEAPDWDELRRVLNGTGAFYIEKPGARSLDRDRFGTETEARTGLPFRWRREMARSPAPNFAASTLKTRSPAACARALASFALRAVDRCLGTRVARGGMAFYFGALWNAPDLRPRLNGCAICGSVHSSDQLRASAVFKPVLLLLVYLCPTCGAPNIFTVDR